MAHSNDRAGANSAAPHELVVQAGQKADRLLDQEGRVSLEDALEEASGVSLTGDSVESNPSPSTWRKRASEIWEENKGVVLMILAQFFGSAMAAIARLMETQTEDREPLNPFQILFARQSITVVLSLIYMWRTKVPEAPLGPKKLRPLLAARGFGGFFGVVGLYFSLLYLPLSDAIVMTFLAPMLAAWVSSILIKTPFTRIQKLAGLVAMLGVILITRPFSLVTSLTEQSAEAGSEIPNPTNSTIPREHTIIHHEPTPAQRAIAVGCGVIGICGAASAYVTISWIGKRAHPLISVTYFSGWCTLVSVIAMAFVPGVGFRMPATVREWTLLVGLGISGFIMQFLLTTSIAHKRSNKVLNMVYSQMLFALAFDKLLFNETPGVLSWLGGGLILGSVLWVAFKADTGKKDDKNNDVTNDNAAREEEEIGLVEGMESDTQPADAHGEHNQPMIELRSQERLTR